MAWEFLGDYGPVGIEYGDYRFYGGAYTINRETEEIVVDVSLTAEHRRNALETFMLTDGKDFPDTVCYVTVNHYGASFNQRVKDILDGGAPYDEGSTGDVMSAYMSEIERNKRRAL